MSEWYNVFNYTLEWQITRMITELDFGPITITNCEMKVSSSQLWLDLSNRKCFQDFNGIRSHGLCVSAAVLRGCRAPPTELWRPIRWEQDNLLNLLYPWKEWNIWILCELRTYKWSEGVIITPSFHLYVRSSHNISKLLIVLITKCSNMIGCEQPLFMA